MPQNVMRPMSIATQKPEIIIARLKPGLGGFIGGDFSPGFSALFCSFVVSIKALNLRRAEAECRCLMRAVAGRLIYGRATTQIQPAQRPEWRAGRTSSPRLPGLPAARC